MTRKTSNRLDSFASPRYSPRCGGHAVVADGNAEHIGNDPSTSYKRYSRSCFLNDPYWEHADSVSRTRKWYSRPYPTRFFLDELHWKGDPTTGIDRRMVAPPAEHVVWRMEMDQLLLHLLRHDVQPSFCTICVLLGNFEFAFTVNTSFLVAIVWSRPPSISSSILYYPDSIMTTRSRNSSGMRSIETHQLMRISCNDVMVGIRVWKALHCTKSSMRNAFGQNGNSVIRLQPRRSNHTSARHSPNEEGKDRKDLHFDKIKSSNRCNAPMDSGNFVKATHLAMFHSTSDCSPLIRSGNSVTALHSRMCRMRNWVHWPMESGKWRSTLHLSRFNSCKCSNWPTDSGNSCKTLLPVVIELASESRFRLVRIRRERERWMRYCRSSRARSQERSLFLLQSHQHTKHTHTNTTDLVNSPIDSGIDCSKLESVKSSCIDIHTHTHTHTKRNEDVRARRICLHHPRATPPNTHAPLANAAIAPNRPANAAVWNTAWFWDVSNADSQSWAWDATRRCTAAGANGCLLTYGCWSRRNGACLWTSVPGRPNCAYWTIWSRSSCGPKRRRST